MKNWMREAGRRVGSAFGRGKKEPEADEEDAVSKEGSSDTDSDIDPEEFREELGDGTPDSPSEDPSKEGIERWRKDVSEHSSDEGEPEDWDDDSSQASSEAEELEKRRKLGTETEGESARKTHPDDQGEDVEQSAEEKELAAESKKSPAGRYQGGFHEPEWDDSKTRESEEVWKSRPAGYRMLSAGGVQVIGGVNGSVLDRVLTDKWSDVTGTHQETFPVEAEREGRFKRFTPEEQARASTLLNETIEAKIHDGELQDVKPQPTKGKTTVYEVKGETLTQIERDDDLIDFKQSDKFSGVLRVERVDSNGELIKDSVDIIEYKDGKVVSVVAGTKGETRVANFGLMIERAQGISVAAEPDRLAGVKLSASVEGEKSPTLGHDEVPKEEPKVLVRGAADAEKPQPKKDLSAEAAAEGRRKQEDMETKERYSGVAEAAAAEGPRKVTPLRAQLRARKRQTKAEQDTAKRLVDTTTSESLPTPEQPAPPALTGSVDAQRKKVRARRSGAAAFEDKMAKRLVDTTTSEPVAPTPRGAKHSREKESTPNKRRRGQAPLI